jgi:hypothetical protein
VGGSSKEVLGVCPQKTYGISVSEADSVWLARIVMDDDRDEALEFVKTVVHQQIVSHERGLLQSHLDGNSEPTATFQKRRETR